MASHLRLVVPAGRPVVVGRLVLTCRQSVRRPRTPRRPATLAARELDIQQNSRSLDSLPSRRPPAPPARELAFQWITRDLVASGAMMALDLDYRAAMQAPSSLAVHGQTLRKHQATKPPPSGHA